MNYLSYHLIKILFYFMCVILSFFPKLNSRELYLLGERYIKPIWLRFVKHWNWFSVVQLLNCVWLCNPMDCNPSGLLVHHQLPEFIQTQVHWVSDVISSSVLPFSPRLQCFPASGSFQMSQFFAQVAKVWEFQLQHQTFQWTLRTDLLYDGLVGSPCSPRDSQESSPTPQFKTSILQRSAFFIVQLSHPYTTTGKTITLTRWTFVGKVMSLLFNMMSRLVIAFLPRSKRLLISWLQSPSAVILEPQNSKVFHC